MTESERQTAVTLTFRGFTVEPQLVEEVMGRRATAIGRVGQPLRPGIRTLLKRSFVQFSVPVDAEIRLDQVVPRLVEYLGGLESIKQARSKIQPEFFEIDIRLPVRGSESQEGGFFPPEVISTLFQLKCTVAFGFI